VDTVSRTPKVSVAILTYNHANTVEDAIRSILAQDLTDYELIVSDDCSTDRTYEVIQELAKQDPRIRAVRTPTNLGMAENANFAAALTRGEYFALLHHDDTYAPDLLRKWSQNLDQHPSAGFVSNAYCNRLDSSLEIHPFLTINAGKPLLEKHMLATWGCPVRGMAMIRRSSWDHVGGMRAQFGMLADVDLWMRLAAEFDVGYVAEPLITVRHARPEDYPADYVQWTWSRLRLGHELYGANHESYFGTSTLRGRLLQKKYRLRVNLDIARWLAYAVVKRRQDLLRTSGGVASSYEYALTRLLRRGLASAAS
jgi:glycosyltransferase involved in cell wall biosynthesis